jgi:hypothetical protein
VTYRYTKKADRLLCEAIQCWIKKRNRTDFSTCPLCGPYKNDDSVAVGSECIRCPIMGRTGSPNCSFTPFWDGADYPKYSDYCNAELKFLRATLRWLRARPGGPKA